MIVWICFAILAGYLLRRIFRHRALEHALHLYGCSKLPKYQHKDPILGIDFIVGTIRSTLEGKSFSRYQSLFAKYGKTFEVNSFRNPALYTMDAENIYAILVLLQRKFVVEPARLPATEAFLGRGIFNSDGSSWEHARDLIRPIFAKAQISNLDSLEARVNILLDLIPRDQSTIDLLPLFKRLFLDTSTEFIFGESVNTLVPGTSNFNAENFLAAFDTALRGVGIRVVLGRFAFLQGLDRSWRKACKEVHTFVDQNIDRAIRNRSKLPTKSSNEKYVLLNELLGETQDRAYLRSQLLNIFVPARDATAIAISNVFFLIARHPYVWSRLRAEVPKKDVVALTFETLKSLKYIRCVLNESLRLIAPSGRSVRMTSEDCILPRGGGSDGSKPVYVQAGTEVNYVFRALQYDNDLWENADEFRPERWESPTSIPPRAYVPFNSGGRVCPAQQMVLNECTYVLVRLVQEFKEIENRDPEEKFIEQHKLQMESRNGVKVAFTAAS